MYASSDGSSWEDEDNKDSRFENVGDSASKEPDEGGKPGADGKKRKKQNGKESKSK